MSKLFDRPIKILKINEVTEEWEEVFEKPLHASINKAKSDGEYLSGGAIQGKRSLVFEMRYFKDLENISFNLQCYRIMYQDRQYDIKDYDDFMEKHKTVKLLGVSC